MSETVAELVLVETEVIEMKESQNLVNIQELLNSYNEFQKDGLGETSISSKFTLNGLDEINELVIEAAIKIDKFTSNGDKKGFFSNISSKAVKTFDPKDAWLGKWFKKASENAKVNDLGNQTPDEIMKNVKDVIEKKKDEVSKLVVDLFKEKKIYLERIETYKKIATKAEHIYNNTSPDTEENFNAQILLTKLKGAIMELQNDIETDINPLITNAKMVVNDLTSKMPTVISKLKGKLNIKTIQQQLSDLTNSAQILTELSEVVDEKVTASIQSTTLQTLDMLKNTGVNVGALKNKINRDEEFKMQLLKKIESVRESKQKEFKEITALSQNVLENKKTSTQLFLDNYSSNTSAGLGDE